MAEFFSIDNTLFTILGYPMSYLEFFGTVLNILCVWLISRRNILTWPVGILAVILFALLFYQIQLYSDFIEQIYFIVTGVYGWILWIRLRGNEAKGAGIKKTVKVRRSGAHVVTATLAIVALGSIGMGYFMSNIHIYFAGIFPTPASFPYLDAFTTVMSFSAQILMAFRRIESWLLWITVDVIGIGLYFEKEVFLVAALYAVFLLLATKGFFNWYKELTGKSLLFRK